MKPTDLRGILQYIPRFRDRTFVIGIDGAIFNDENFNNLLLDIAVLRSLNIRVLLVHGVSAQIKHVADLAGFVASNLNGAGVTDSETLRISVTAANQLAHRLLEGLSASGLRGAITNGIVAYPMGIIQGVDHLHTGKVEKVDAEFFQILLAQGIVPVVPPIGFDGEGRTYRVNSDSIALALATALSASKIIFITPFDGIYQQGKLLRQIMAVDLDALLKTRRIEVPEQMVSKVNHSVLACMSGVNRVHLINGGVEEGLLAEVFSNEGVGTLIHANEYQQIRPARKKDVRHIMSLTKKSVQTEELAKRSRANLEKQLGDYFIFEIDKNLVGCVALHVYAEAHKGELAFLFVSSSHENQGIGSRLVQFVENRARDLGLKELLVLSTQAFTYFQTRCGFVEASPDDLPPERRERYEQSGRRSKVLKKVL